MRFYNELFNKIISLENLFSAWDEFKKDKRKKRDVMEFECNLEGNIFKLHEELAAKIYRHSPYTSFYINDPKQRHIYKAEVRDRVLHHAVFSVLNPVFEATFIPASFSCRLGKGTHKGVEFLAKILRQVSGNGHNPCYALKCDIKKFFDTVNHKILLEIICRKIKDKDTLWLIKEIIESYQTNYSTLFERRGIPIGNLTSQLFANLYLNELDQFVKQNLKVKFYVRYTDDFVIAADDAAYLKYIILEIKKFLNGNLDLRLHPSKISIRKFSQGIDFLGYVLRPHHRLIRTKTKKRIFKKIRLRIKEYKGGIIKEEKLEQSLQSYLGVLSHANAYKLGKNLKNLFWLH
ncbi:MAG TPA: RNA-dependent DNA polymerase [Candidatus Uhrbacteria bacterium]|nr:RNA-dependent DNA polymerase [Candidatus Uhrbacteria bacterium]